MINHKYLLFCVIFLTTSFFAFGGLGFCHVMASSTNTKGATKSYTRIFYYREGENALASLFTHPDSIDILAPQSYSIDSDGKLSGDVSSSVLDFAHNKGIKVMPLVTNKAFGQASIDTVLNDQSKQDVVIGALVSEAKQKGYYGFQIDFEQMDLSYRDKFSAFIKRFHDSMKANNLAASVAVISKTSDDPNDYKNDLWQKLIGVYDYDALGANADFVSVMSYDDPDSKGPIARYTWLKKVLTYSMLHIPKNKISLGIGLYYWLWDDVTDKLVGIGGYEGMSNVLKKHKTTYVYSTKNHEAYLTYIKKKKHYTMWYENGKSIADKISIIKKYRLNGFSAWALGLEVPSVHDVL